MEEVLRKIQDTNQRLQRDRVKNVAIVSLNVEALYPSIDQVEEPRIVAEAIRESRLKYQGVGMHLVGVYLGLVWNKVRLFKEGIWRLLPRRKVTRSRNTTVHTQELGGLQRQRRKIVLQEDEVHIGKKMDKHTDP